MYLKKIESQGFKSFANKIVLEFQPGIMGIVGPNGSGKSNIADAVRWVLGEQSAKTLRGGSMQDVIFAGTANRKPQGYAYVSLTIDNADHALAIDFSEVVVTRRVYRSGESEYLLNNNTCRLRDINELFYDTGVGKEGYSIIGQGQIDKILSSKPEDRRELFDEAAGIVKFKKRKTVAVKKLEEEQQNLLRVNDILGELERQVGPLKAQAETARTYLHLRDELKRYEIGAFSRDNEDLRKKFAAVEEKLTAVEGDLFSSNEDSEQRKKEYEQISSQKERIDRALENLQQQRGDLSVEKESAEGRIRLLQEQINTLKAGEEQLQDRLTALEEERQMHLEEKEQYVREKGELNERVDAVEDEVYALEEELESQDELTKNIEQDFDEYNRLLLSGATARAELSADRTALQDRIHQTGEQLDRLKIDLGNAGLEQEEKTVRLAGLKESLAGVHLELSDCETSGRALVGKLTDAGNALREGQERLAEVHRKYQAQKARLEALVNMAERYEGYGESIRRVMERKKQISGIHGVVADLIHVEKKYQTAIETALGGHIQNIVTDTENTARELVEYLKQNRYGRVTFLPLDAVHGKASLEDPGALKEKGALGIASELVTTEQQYVAVIRHLLGRVLVVDTVEHALQIARKYRYRMNIVTLEGESLTPGGAISGGAYRNNSNLLARQAEMDALEKTLKQMEKDGKELAGKQEDLQAALNALADQAEETKTRLSELRIREATVAMELKQTEEDLSRNDRSIREKQEEAARTEELVRMLHERELKSETALAEADRNREAADERGRVLQERLEAEREKQKALSERLNEKRLEASKLAERSNFLMDNILRINRENTALDEKVHALLAQADPGGKRVADKVAEIVELKRGCQEYSASLERIDREASAASAERDDLGLRIKRVLDARDEDAERIRLLDKEASKLQNQKERLTEAIDQQAAYLWEEYQMTPSEAESLPYNGEESIADLRRLIKQHKASIKELGPVNVNAIEEEKEVCGRYDFLSAQHEDIVKARDNLLEIIEELEKGMRVQFEEKFAFIKREFDSVFQDLFGGGTGTLELIREEDSDILDCGIAIIAQPPGKKLQNMMQLSGGEKALTAIALIFAIQNLKPSPFCLVDEIEAALDEPNVVRFADYLQRLKKHTQILAITHRRGTMEKADRLYGITMQEKGVSTLVSVDLTDTDLIEEEHKE